ncbi:MAG: TIGR00725 family protein [Candidatus Thorarchaeota archaeon]
MMTYRIISIIGGSDSNHDVLELAEQTGAEIAKRGVALACGGLGGVMEAACRGAKKFNGLTIGILPTEVKEHANEYVDIVIPTGLGYARNFLVAKAGDAVIALDGSAGTLSEIAIAWFSDRPIVALTKSGGWAQKLAGTQIDGRRNDVVYSAETPREAVQMVFDALNWK